MLQFYQGLSEIYDWAANCSKAFPPADGLYRIAHPHMDGNIRTVLDVGIGTGLSSKPFAAAGYQVTGVDGSPEMIHKCMLKGIARRILRADFEKAALPFAANAFDMSFSANTLYLLPNAEKVIDDMIRVTKPGGLVAFNYEVSESGRLQRRENDATLQIDRKQIVYTYALPQDFAASVLRDRSMKIIAAEKGPVAIKKDGSPLVFETLVAQKPSL